MREAKTSLKDTSVIYCIINNETGTIYIGSSLDIYGRIMDNLIYNCR
jgi:hypothetical protein